MVGDRLGSFAQVVDSREVGTIVVEGIVGVGSIDLDTEGLVDQNTPVVEHRAVNK
jgi:hypothetical protein